jgi:hypothetical protein
MASWLLPSAQAGSLPDGPEIPFRWGVISLFPIRFSLGLRRYFQPRNVALGMKPLEDFQTPSLVFLARLDLKRRRFIPAAFDFGVNERQKHLMAIAGNRRADSVESEWLRVLNWRGRV